jgi:hypothetical protein
MFHGYFSCSFERRRSTIRGFAVPFGIRFVWRPRKRVAAGIELSKAAGNRSMIRFGTSSFYDCRMTGK